MKYQVLLLLFVISINSFSQTVIEEGIAYIGSGLTIEDAEKIALNDAKQKALNSMGMFIESSSRVVNSILEKDEIFTITGAIMTSKIIKTQKDLLNDQFVLRIKAEFNIDKKSLIDALKTYQERNKEKATIKFLTTEIIKLEKELLKKDKNNSKFIEVLDEVNISSNRLVKLLTTKQIINHESEIQIIYKNKIEKELYNQFIPKLNQAINKIISWSTIPIFVDERLVLPLSDDMQEQYRKFDINNLSSEIKIFDYLIKGFKKICSDYEKQGLKIRPVLSFQINFYIPIIIYINERRMDKFRLNIEIRNLSVNNYSGYLLLYIRANWVSMIGDNFNRNGYIYPLYITHWGIPLPSTFKLNNIEDINIRFGQPDLKNLQIDYFPI